MPVAVGAGGPRPRYGAPVRLMRRRSARPAPVRASGRDTGGAADFRPGVGHEDLDDHYALRKDSVFTVLAGKSKPVLRSDCEALTRNRTLTRLEHTPERHQTMDHKIDCDGAAVDALLVDLFLGEHERALRGERARSRQYRHPALQRPGRQVFQ